jgi:type IV pilus assembly protein PilW
MLETNENGFTMIELLIAMALTGLVMTGVSRVYSQQVAVNNTQNIVRDMQQNIRSAMYYMETEIRMAGLDPSGNAGAGVELAETGEVTVSADIGGPGAIPGDPNEFFNGAVDADERVSYRLDTDADRNGICDNLEAFGTAPCNLVRVSNGVTSVIAQNIDALDFEYLGVDSTDPTCENDCPIVGNTGLPGRPITNGRLDDIRAIQITVVARAGGDSLPGFILPMDDNRLFRGQRGQIVLGSIFTNDGFRRNSLTNEINLRNMGLQ